ncbi:MAG: hypothetical protein JXA97_10940 [Anaerolineales bacterium]|nr:hypothetical protein [Anaerolineales bacterium]
MISQASKRPLRLIAIFSLAAAAAILLISTEDIPTALAPIFFILIFTLAPNRR